MRSWYRWVQVIAQDAGSQSSAVSSAASPMTQPSGGQYAHVLLLPRGHSLARRALLRDIMRLCIFFGQETTLELLIPILNTFFNDKVRTAEPIGRDPCSTEYVKSDTKGTCCRLTGSCAARFVTTSRRCVPLSGGWPPSSTSCPVSTRPL